MKLLGQVKFRSWNCDVYLTSYSTNGANAIKLIDAEDGAPLGTASANLPSHIQLGATEVAIKDYSENAGILEVLVDAGIISDPISYSYSNFTNVPICTINQDLLA